MEERCAQLPGNDPGMKKLIFFRTIGKRDSRREMETEISKELFGLLTPLSIVLLQYN